MKLGGGGSTTPAPLSTTTSPQAALKTGPSPRMSAMLAVQRSTLYVYGGVLEKDDKQFYLSDLYSLGEFVFLCRIIPGF